jgi:predicted alternative tryptophan synthase beta-subunit
MDKIKISLNESDIPRQWYNLAADFAHAKASPAWKNSSRLNIGQFE